MSRNIVWQFNIQAPEGPRISASKNVPIEAFDSIKVTVFGQGAEGGPDENKEVEVQPGTSAGQVVFLAVTADKYDANLTYKLNPDQDPPIILDMPHVLVGKGAVGLLAQPPTSLFFSSKIAENTEIHVLVGRDATPSDEVAS